jgi:hypothetical protein
VNQQTELARDDGDAPAAPSTRYKFLRLVDGQIHSSQGGLVWQIGVEQRVSGPLALCVNGLHCSRLIIDALHYVQGEVLAEVEVVGNHVDDGDKEAWQAMTIRRAWRWTGADSVALAVFAAEAVLSIWEARYPEDERPRVAIETAKRGGARAAAAAAAAAAAEAAAWAAEAAAWAAAWAAEAAARAAAEEAEAAEAADSPLLPKRRCH